MMRKFRLFGELNIDSTKADMAPKLSVIMPVYNEAKTVCESIARVLQVPIDKELIVVDDGSRDDTSGILKNLADQRL